MDREKAQEILEAYGRPSAKVGNTKLTFSRQTEEDLNEIESKTDEELIQNWKNLVWLNEIYGQVSLSDMQRISLIELEFECRKIAYEPLIFWYEDASAKFDEEKELEQQEIEQQEIEHEIQLQESQQDGEIYTTQ